MAGAFALERLLVIRTGSTAESLWACEQALRHLRGGVVMAWPEVSGFTQLRRLQLAAAAGRKTAFLFRPDSGSGTASPSALRLQLDSSDSDTLVTILKCRGRRTQGAGAHPAYPHAGKTVRTPGNALCASRAAGGGGTGSVTTGNGSSLIRLAGKPLLRKREPHPR